MAGPGRGAGGRFWGGLCLAFLAFRLGATEKLSESARVDYCVSIVESQIVKSQDQPGRVFSWLFRYAPKGMDVGGAQRNATGNWKSLEAYFAQLVKDDPKNVLLVEKVTLAWLRACFVAPDWSDTKTNRDKLAEWRKTLMERLEIKTLAPGDLP